MTLTIARYTILAAPLAANALTRRNFDGREFAVSPCVAIVAGVLNGELVPASVIAESVEGWNGRPVPISHPRLNGSFVTANRPDVIERQVIGTVFNAAFDADRLKVELWIDVEKCRRLGGAALAVLTRLDAGLPLEVSTAYICDVEEASGVTQNGERYKGIQHNLRPDHIAVLPDETGACSWEDGCGAPRENQCRCKERASQGVANMTDQNTEEPTGADAAVTEVEPVVEPEVEPEAPALEHNAEAEQPEQPEPEQEKHNGSGMDDDERRKRMEEVAALIGEFGGIEKVASTLYGLGEVAAMVDSLGGAEAVKTMLSTLKGNADEHKRQLVERIGTYRGNAFTADDLQAMSAADLEKLERTLRPHDYSGRVSANSTVPPAPTWSALPPPPTYTVNTTKE